MCLLAVAFHIHPDSPLIVAANRDELLARPSTPLTVLESGPLRILGGRDLVAGGTWLAVNELGLVAGLTNLPTTAGRNPLKRSRGELPLALARQTEARRAVEAFAASFSPRDYNPAWLLAGDRDALLYIDMTGDEAQITALNPGLHVLENRALTTISPKADLVRARFADAMSLRGEEFLVALKHMLASHEIPARPSDLRRPPETNAACVHAGPYGTRSSTIVVVPPDASRPRILFADGPPCTTEYTEPAL